MKKLFLKWCLTTLVTFGVAFIAIVFAREQSLQLSPLIKIMVALIAAADVLKPDAAATIRRLREMGIAVAMLTGDNRGTAEAIARRAGIERVLAEVLPEDKAGEVARETRGTAHWWKNLSDKTVILLAFDIRHDPKDKHM